MWKRVGSTSCGFGPPLHQPILLAVAHAPRSYPTSTLFARRDEVEQAWRIVDSIIAGWKALDMQPLPYQAGSWGPEEAGTVLGSDRVWRRP